MTSTDAPIPCDQNSSPRLVLPAELEKHGVVDQASEFAGPSELEKEPVVDQALHPALWLLNMQPEYFARQGSVVASWRSDGRGGRWGPYYRLTYRADGRQKSIYLGREGPLVAAVRAKLAELQEPRHRRQWLKGVEAAARVSLRACKRALSLHLGLRGLTLKGLEIRGWRRIGFPRLPALRWPQPPGLVLLPTGEVCLT